MEETETIETRIRAQAVSASIRVTVHAHQEMVEDEVTLDEVLYSLKFGRLLEYYPEHKRGACCLMHGRTAEGRDLHVVCTTSHSPLIIITVYVPIPPKWITPTTRRPAS